MAAAPWHVEVMQEEDLHTRVAQHRRIVLNISNAQTALRMREDQFSSPQVQGRRKERLLLPAETTKRPYGGSSARWHREGLIRPLHGLVFSHSSCCCSLCIPSAPEQLLPLAGCPTLEQDVSDLVCREGSDAH